MLRLQRTTPLCLPKVVVETVRDAAGNRAPNPEANTLAAAVSHKAGKVKVKDVEARKGAQEDVAVVVTDPLKDHAIIGKVLAHALMVTNVNSVTPRVEIELLPKGKAITRLIFNASSLVLVSVNKVKNAHLNMVAVCGMQMQPLHLRDHLRQDVKRKRRKRTSTERDMVRKIAEEAQALLDPHDRRLDLLKHLGRHTHQEGHEKAKDHGDHLATVATALPLYF